MNNNQSEKGLKKLTEDVRKVGLANGADLVGFCKSVNIEKIAPIGHKPSELLSNAKSLVVLACGSRLNEDRSYFYRWGPNFALTYVRLKEEVGRQRADARKSIQAVQDCLTAKGYDVVIEPHGWQGIISFKQVLYLAGLGFFGKGNFIVNPKLGPLNTLAVMLTNAALIYGEPINNDACGICTECIKACKYGAFKPLDIGFQWIGEKCRCYDLIMNPVNMKWTYGPCNSKCVNVCPIGKPTAK